MAIDSSWGSTHLKRNEIFSAQMKEMFDDQLMAQSWVNWISEIPMDSIGTELKINSIGDLTVDQASESKPLPVRRMDTGQYKFVIDEFVGNKVAFTDTFFEESFQANQVLSKTPVKMKEAFDRYLETAIFQIPREQTQDDANVINTAAHRFVGSGNGTDYPVNSLSLADFSYAKLALKKANAPMSNLIAVVSPEIEHNLNITSNIVDVSNNPRWEGIIETGMLDTTGIRFIRNIYGWDIYVSEFLDQTTANEANLTTYDGTAVADTTGFTSSVFMTVADSDSSPFMGAWGRTPSIKSWRDEDIETEFHQLTSKFGLGLYRPESLVTILTSNDVA